MTDIVDRLRTPATLGEARTIYSPRIVDEDLLREAAAEIERLRVANVYLRGEVGRLTAELEDAKDRSSYDGHW